MVEFALVLPLVLLVVFAAVEVAVVARTQLEVVNAAREGAREAATNPDPAAAVGVVALFIFLLLPKLDAAIKKYGA